MKPDNDNKISVGILTPPVLAAGITPLSNLVSILSIHSHPLYLVTANEGCKFFENDVRVTVSGVFHHDEKNLILRIVKYLLFQIRISIAFTKVVKKSDIWIFFLGGETMVFPMVIAKLFRKKVFLLYGGSVIQIYFLDKFAVFWIKLLTVINCTLSNKLILYSKNFITEWNLEKWENKIEFAHEHIIDFQKFRTTKQLNERKNLVGFIGRFSEEKGICNFIQAIRRILRVRKDITFYIAGDGSLHEDVRKYIDQKQLGTYVKIGDWISHDELPEVYNNLKLIVIPSYTEGLPNVMLESIACGTPVLATSVGMIPTIIKNEETGFILKNNSPQCIAESIIRIVDSPYLEKNALNARKKIEGEFSIESTADRWKTILERK
jgi:glycosyltransferase involved in cell wall biosynthesis